jgi:hypothetical protein
MKKTSKNKINFGDGHLEKIINKTDLQNRKSGFVQMCVIKLLVYLWFFLRPNHWELKCADFIKKWKIGNPVTFFVRHLEKKYVSTRWSKTLTMPIFIKIKECRFASSYISNGIHHIWRIPFEKGHLFENFGSTFSDLNQTFFEFY